MTLDTLLARAIVSRYHERQWFAGATLQANLLLIDGDAAHVMFVEHMWKAQFQVLIPDLTIRQKPADAPKPVKPATKFSSLKPGPWRDALDGHKDLLD